MVRSWCVKLWPIPLVAICVLGAAWPDGWRYLSLLATDDDRPATLDARHRQQNDSNIHAVATGPFRAGLVATSTGMPVAIRHPAEANRNADIADVDSLPQAMPPEPREIPLSSDAVADIEPALAKAADIVESERRDATINADRMSLPVRSDHRKLPADGHAHGMPATATGGRCTLPRQPVDLPTETIPCWPRPAALIAELDRLAQNAPDQDWARHTIGQIDRLSRLTTLDAPEAGEVLSALERQRQALTKTIDATAEGDRKRSLKRVRYSIQRRIAVWRRIHELASHSTFVVTVADSHGPDLRQRVAAAATMLDDLRGKEAWRKYLLFDDLQRVVNDEAADEADRRRVARRTLSRIESSAIDERQRELLERQPLADLTECLRRWVSEPVDYVKLLHELERFELDGGSAAARSVAHDYQALRWSAADEVKQLSQQINAHYRNANMRLAVTEAYINRLMPPPHHINERIRDRLRGADILGRHNSSNQLFVKLFPDRGRLRVGIETVGEGDSETEAYRGAFTVGNEGSFRFRGRKLVTVDNRGVSVWRAEADADSDTYITGVESDFDGIPILGPLIRTIARQRVDGETRAAQREIERMLANRIVERMDAGVHEQIEKAERNFQTKWLDPLERLQLNPVPVSMETTEHRLIVRYRLAASTQLASHTPRPLAKSDSMISLQLHQSAVNNLVGQLKLDGKSFKLDELFQEIGRKFDRPNIAVPSDAPRDVTIEFAAQDAVRIACDEGRVTVTLHIAKLSQGNHHGWRNFKVSVNYIPDSSRPDACFIRDPSPDDYIAIQGIRKILHRAAVAGIFSKIFSPSQPITILPAQLAHDPRMADLYVSQFDIVDGWIGFALAADPNYDPDPLANTADGQRKRLR